MVHSVRIPKKPAPTRQVGDRTDPRRPLRLLSVRETGLYAKVSDQTVRRWIKAGHIKVYRAGRQIRIDETDLVDLLSSQELKWL